MSVKIYTAYRLKKSKDLWPFMRDVRRKGVENVRAVLREMYTNFIAAVDEVSDEYKEALKTFKTPQRTKEHLVERLMTKNYRTQASSSDRNPFNFDVSIAVREHKGRLYLIPHCDWMMRDVLNFLKDDHRLEDFAYWDNTDPPENVPYRKFKARGKIWDAIDHHAGCSGFEFYQDGWSDYLAIEICSPDAFWKINPFLQIRAEAARKKKRKKT